MSDPVASKSTFLCMYMKNHPDTLVAYVKWFGKVQGNVVTATMTSIDSQCMTLSYKLKNGEASSVRVQFDPPLANYEQVKPRLLAMKANAQEGLGMIQTPHLTTFRLPLSVLITPLSLATAPYIIYAPLPGTALPFLSAPAADLLFAPAHAFVNATGFHPRLTTFLSIIGIVHALETVYTWTLCKRYVKGAFVTASYLVSTFLFGLPVWSDLKKRVQEKRIESVMKAE
ncbi:hypothetical protein F5I97DRAFT_1939203 [Phlebopus sp. FC_14]|nr:hypothetical protein F5I97DRAFT_1939203 [Phlebopus sp. FC_14]